MRPGGRDGTLGPTDICLIGGQAMAKPESVFIYVGTYPGQAQAREDYRVVKDLHLSLIHI